MAALFIIAKIWKQPSYPSLDEIDKENVYTIECLFSLRKKEFMSSAATWMNLVDLMLSEISQHRKMNIT